MRKAVAISSDELRALMNAIPANKRVLILDTCAAGKLVEKLTERRDISGSQIRALERLKDRTGLHILAGCAADRVSYETSRYGQGLLTYSLLLGMRGAALREEEFVDVGKLFGFAADKVPELAKDIGGVQRPLVASPRAGASFDIGRLTKADKARVPLRSVRPLVLRANFQNEATFDDGLGFGSAVNRALADAAARGRAAKLVFVDAQEFPAAYRLAGRYRIEGDQVHVTARLFLKGEQKGEFTVSGKKSELGNLAGQVVSKAAAQLK